MFSKLYNKLQDYKEKKYYYALTIVWGLNLSLIKKLFVRWGFNINIVSKQILDIFREDIILYNNTISFFKYWTTLLVYKNEKSNLFFKTLIAVGHYKGKRLLVGLPLKGQRTHTNAKTSKKLLGVYKNKY